jgi:hypothetical protein
MMDATTTSVTPVIPLAATFGPNAIDTSSDGTVVAGLDAGIVVRVDFRSGAGQQIFGRAGYGPMVGAIACHPKAADVAVIGMFNGNVVLVHRGGTLTLAEGDYPINGVAWVPDGQQLGIVPIAPLRDIFPGQRHIRGLYHGPDPPSRHPNKARTQAASSGCFCRSGPFITS